MRSSMSAHSEFDFEHSTDRQGNSMRQVAQRHHKLWLCARSLSDPVTEAVCRVERNALPLMDFGSGH